MRVLLLSALLLASPGVAFAQAEPDPNFAPPAAAANAPDPSGRVGRVALIDGKLSEHAPGDTNWFPASRNDPVAAGAGFWAEPGARAELTVGADAIRLDGGSELTIERLDEEGTGLVLSQGRMRVTSSSARPMRISTPRGDAEVGGKAELHVDAGSETVPTRISVLNGEAIVRSDDGEKRVAAGESVRLQGAGPYSGELSRGVEHTAFDDWVDRRLQGEQKAIASLPPKTVSVETTGYQDLAGYGSWQNDPAYGQVWYPTEVADDWAPYRYGHWRYVAPWGYTWVDDAPWGYAPFHYGRWAYVGNRWGWVPGTYVARPVWAPALVAFAAIASGGPVGWVPLAPREVYRPWYHASPRYLREVNVTHVTNVTIINNRPATVSYANRSYATAAPRQVFSRGGEIGRAHERIDPTRFERARAAPPTALRAALPAPAAPQAVAAAAAPPAPSLQVRPSRSSGGYVRSGNGPNAMSQQRPAPPAAAAGQAAAPPTPMSQQQAAQPNGRPALPQAGANAAHPERFQNQRPADFQDRLRQQQQLTPEQRQQYQDRRQQFQQQQQQAGQPSAAPQPQAQSQQRPQPTPEQRQQFQERRQQQQQQQQQAGPPQPTAQPQAQPQQRPQPTPEQRQQFQERRDQRQQAAPQPQANPQQQQQQQAAQQRAAQEAQQRAQQQQQQQQMQRQQQMQQQAQQAAQQRAAQEAQQRAAHEAQQRAQQQQQQMQRQQQMQQQQAQQAAQQRAAQEAAKKAPPSEGKKQRDPGDPNDRQR